MWKTSGLGIVSFEGAGLLRGAAEAEKEAFTWAGGGGAGAAAGYSGE